MPQFDWTVTLGNLLSTVVILFMFVGGAYRFVYNHLKHWQEQINMRFDKVDLDVRELREFAFRQRNE